MSVPPPHFAPPPAPQVGTIPLSFQSLKTVYAGAWRTVTKNPAATFWLPNLWFMIASIALAAGIGFWMKRFLEGLWLNLGTLGPYEEPSLSDIEAVMTWGMQDMVIWMSLGLLGYSLCVLIGTTITVAPTMRGILGLPTSASDAWSLAKPHLPRVLVAGLLAWLAAVVVLVLTAWASQWFISLTLATEFSDAASTAQFTTTTTLASTLFTFGAYFLEIALLLLMVRFVHVLPAMVLEQKSLFAAMGRSWRLITGRYWQVLGTLYLASLIIGLILGIVLGILIAAVVMIAAGFWTGSTPEEIFASVSVLTLVLVWLSTALTWLVTTPLLPVTTLLYADNRFRKEGLLEEMFPLALNEPTLAAARNGDPHALQTTSMFVPGTITPHWTGR